MDKFLIPRNKYFYVEIKKSKKYSETKKLGHLINA